MLKIAGLLLCLFVTPVFGDEIHQVSLPDEVKQEVRNNPDDELIKGKVWNRWTSDNFVVCSINNDQAKYLNANLEKIKNWVYTRWGLPDVKFTAECRILCVDDKELFKKLFGLEESKVEVRRDANGKIKLSVIYLLLNEKPAKTLPLVLTEVCLSEFEQQNQTKFGWWAHRGMSKLDGTLEEIRLNLTNLKPILAQDQPIFFTKGLMTMTEQEYQQQSVNNRLVYDQCAVCLTLLLRKEYGQDKFLECLRDTAVGKKTEPALSRIYMYDNFSSLDSTFKTYMFDLTTDIINRRTPDSYLQILAKP